MKKIKILYTIPNFDTAGSGKALLNIAKGLDKDIFEPHIMCLHDRGEFFKTVKASGIPIHIYSYLSNPRPLSALFNSVRKISKKFKEIKPDIIHSFHYAPDYTEALAAKLAGITWTFTKKNMNWGGASKNAWKLRSLLAKRIIIQNTDMKNKMYPTSKKTDLISRGVNTTSFAPLEQKNKELRKKFNTGIDQRILITVANMAPVKGIELLIQSFANLEEVNHNWVIWLVGNADNPYGKELKKLVKEKDLEDKIIFTGKQLAVNQFLNEAEVFVLPTKNIGEGSPVALLEAMASGTTVIGSKVPGINDQLENYQSHLFQPENIVDLEQVLRNFLILNTKDLMQQGAMFRDFVKKNYSIEIEVEKHEVFYKKILA
ncbi:glycosyltransferase [Mesonia ostreae]|uniref:Glycosyltransferase n=1 Tax=Mesonia ostreae TaxID=861110 RepID=A0ABU2KM41_9FLAO|nr:glycosyltransferase [Mesonia ostreae]MDT0295733.1 glycosyltransferase [Mesonia ostreae]